MPGPFDYARGISRVAHKLEPLFGVDLRERSPASLGTPPSAIDFVNDADAFLIGEWWVGAAAGHRRAAGVTLGTGVGSAYLLDGRIVRHGTARTPGRLLTSRGVPVADPPRRRSRAVRSSRATASQGSTSRMLPLRARPATGELGDVFAELAGALGELASSMARLLRGDLLRRRRLDLAVVDLLGPGLHDGLSAVPRLQAVEQAAHVEEAALLGAAYRASQAA